MNRIEIAEPSQPQPARLADHAGAGSRLASLQFNFGGSSSLRSAASMHARRLAKPASVCARRSAKHLPIVSFQLSKNFIGSRVVKGFDETLSRFRPTSSRSFICRVVFEKFDVCACYGQLASALPSVRCCPPMSSNASANRPAASNSAACAII
jgi:hypothetical protein